MQDWAPVTELLLRFLPLLIAIVFIIAVFAIANMVSKRQLGKPGNVNFRRQWVMVGLSLVSVVLIVMVLPISGTTRGQLLSLLGILLSAAIALSSTTFVVNAMAGIMLRVIKGFRAGDFVEINGHFGRVSERGLFHTEIQTQDRDLITLPNLYLVTNPIEVVRSDGTIVTATVSLGYDVPRKDAAAALVDAAADANLLDPFVRITELADYSVSYRTAGLLTETKNLLSARSSLREKILDRLHGAGIEIVSPNFTNMRRFPPEASFIPRITSSVEDEEQAEDKSPEQIAFDKADKAEAEVDPVVQLESIDAKLETIVAGIERVGVDVANAGSEDSRAESGAALAKLVLSKQELELERARVQAIIEELKQKE